MTTTADWAALASRLSSALHLDTAPIALAFGPERPEGVAAYDAPFSEPAEDGRRGRVPASCVFWGEAGAGAFSTVAEDHGNCSVGRVTHGFAGLDEVAHNGDVAALLDSGWVDAEAVGTIPAITTRPGAITYAPLAAVPDAVEPDVVLLKVNGRQLMVLSDALPGLSIEGKPQCHIVALAAEAQIPAASVGCALSRVRTGMAPEEMTCALPAGQLASIVDAVEATGAVDAAVAKYAASDRRRFA